MRDREQYYALQPEFFETRLIKRLRKFAGGDTYVIAYIRMLAIASQQNGMITSEGTGLTLPGEIALELDMAQETIEILLSILENCWLIERVSDTAIYFKQCQDLISIE